MGSALSTVATHRRPERARSLIELRRVSAQRSFGGHKHIRMGIGCLLDGAANGPLVDR
jgi:hypothetical protein